MVVERINQYLVDHGISKAFLARKLNVNRSSFYLIMSGRRRMPADMMVRICDVLEVSADVFREKKDETADC